MTALYSGGESSRLYDGQYVVRSRFTWPWGQPGEDETEPAPYEDCMDWLAAAPHTELEVSDGSRIHRVRVERAWIEAVDESREQWLNDPKAWYRDRGIIP